MAQPAQNLPPSGKNDNAKHHKLSPRELRLVLIISVYVLSLLAFFVYSLVAVWPANPGTFANSTSTSAFRFLNASYALPNESRILLIVAIVGAIGALIHSAWALGAFVGERQFDESWTLWYLAHPFVGAGLALLIYFGLRGGLLNSGTTVNDLNLFGIATVSGLSGMFAKQAIGKLKELADNLFGKAQPKSKPPPTSS